MKVHGSSIKIVCISVLDIMGGRGGSVPCGARFAVKGWKPCSLSWHFGAAGTPRGAEFAGLAKSPPCSILSWDVGSPREREWMICHAVRIHRVSVSLTCEPELGSVTRTALTSYESCEEGGVSLPPDGGTHLFHASS